MAATQPLVEREPWVVRDEGRLVERVCHRVIVARAQLAKHLLQRLASAGQPAGDPLGFVHADDGN